MIERFADVVVRTGANVQPGQVVAIGTEPGKEVWTRAVARAAYRAGARFVDVWSFDVAVKRARLEHAAEDQLDYVPPWLGQRLLDLGRLRGARIALSGSVAATALAGLDPQRVARDRLPEVPELFQTINEQTVNWTVAPAPTAAWARVVYPSLPPGEALARLESDVAHALRLDAEDPTVAWRARMGQLGRVAAALTTLRFETLRLHGGGTKLRIGLLPTSVWRTAARVTVDGVEHIANLPTEEVFTAPNPLRADGVLRATRPLALGGTLVHGLQLRFEAGRAVDVRADAGGEVLAGVLRRDPGAMRLGEVALVDGEGRVGRLGTVFCDTLLDENAGSHLALGTAYESTVADPADRARLNRSEIHVDVTFGSRELAVDGQLAGGRAVPLMRQGRWTIEH
jgi:aminopeptidase